MSDLRILISGMLDTEKSTVDINKQLTRMEHRLRKLNLKVNIDPNALKTLHNFNSQMQNLQASAINTKKVIEEAVMPDGTKVKRTFYDGMNREFSEVVEKAKQTSNSMDKVNSSTKKTTNSTKELNQEMTKKLKLNRESVVETNKGLGNLKQEYSDTKSIHNVQVERNKQGKIITARYSTNHQKAKQVTEQEKLQTAELKRQLDLEQRKIRVQSQEMIRQYPSIDRTRVGNILAESEAMKVQGNTIKSVKNKYSEFGMKLKEVETQTKKVTANTNTMAGAFQNAMVNFAV